MLMNECLPHARSVSQRTGPLVTEVLDRAFTEAPDLSDLSYAARRVLVGAAALFYDNGAPGTSVRDIARSCGLSPGAFYNHFDSKDDVLYRLVKHGHDSLDARIELHLSQVPPSPTAQLAAFVHAYVMAHLLQPEIAQLVRREYLHLSPERLALVVGRRRKLREKVTSILRKGSRSGEFTLIGGRNAPIRTAVMILDMCSRTSEWYDPRRLRAERPERLTSRYVDAALRLTGADSTITESLPARRGSGPRRSTKVEPS